jgi:ribosomal protein L29
MKTNDLKSLHTKTKEELESLLRDKNLEYSKIKMDIKSGRIKNTRLGFNLRKEMTKIKTILNKKV